jgi:sn1-specific diacylglycerol lipase
MRDSDLHPSHRKESNGSTGGKDKLRLFEVLDVKNVFAQIVFAKDMLRCVHF